MKKPGVLFVMNTLRPGGAEMFVLRLAKYLSNNFQIHIHSCFPEQDEPAFVEQFRTDLEFEFLEDAPKIGKAKSWFFWKMNAIAALLGHKGLYVKLCAWQREKYFRKELNRRNIKVVNSSSAHADSVAVNFFKKNFGIPAVLSLHSAYNQENWGADPKANEAFIAAVKPTLRGADALLYTADHNAAIFEHVPPTEQQVVEKIYLGYEPKPISKNRIDLGWPNDAFVVSMMARGIPEKGWKPCIDAFLKLTEVKPNSMLILIHTDTEHMQELRKKFQEVKSIVFAGFLSDPSAVLSNSDCTVLPSHYPESLPYAITESLAYSRPVFATPVAEIPQMLHTDAGPAGGIIPFTSAGVADDGVLADYLIKMASDSAHSKELCDRAHNAYQKFSMENCGGRYAQIINRLIDAR